MITCLNLNVFVDVLLSVMSEDSQLNQANCKSVSELLQPQLTLDSLKHILEVIDLFNGEGEGDNDSDNLSAENERQSDGCI